MAFLLLSILCSTSILIIFKYLDYLKIQLFPTIVVNYITATIAGALISVDPGSFAQIIHSNWLFMAIIIGLLLIIMFFVIGWSTQKAGITVTIIAGRMSMVIPMVFSIIYYSELVSFFKIIGVLAAISAVILTIYRKDIKKSYIQFIYLPIILFIGAGITDTFVKISQNDFVSQSQFSLFTTFVFSISAITGIIIAIIKKYKFNELVKPKSLIFGILLGLVNYGSLLFFIKALQYSNMDSSVVFGINSLSIVALSVIVAFLIFREKIHIINWIGISVSLIAIILLNFA
ncbi:MAG: EamA family transporter [Chlorobi bacterium]|nr:EamA family transporter [Chlorobiota bacterium]